ncbi:MAG: hypothetical protein R3B41_00190 [Candidatus Doudnabacteria bacterium]
MIKHKLVGKKVAQVLPQFLITVGEKAQFIAQEAIAEGLSSGNVMSCDNTDQAIQLLRDLDILDAAILIKGSRGMHLDKVSRELLQEPSTADLVIPR